MRLLACRSGRDHNLTITGCPVGVHGGLPARAHAPRDTHLAGVGGAAARAERVAGVVRQRWGSVAAAARRSGSRITRARPDSRHATHLIEPLL